MRLANKFLCTLALAASCALPASAAKNKTKGLPPAGSGPAEVDAKPMQDAKSKLALAQGKVERAQDALATLIAQLHKQADTAPALVAAQDELKQAQYAYDSATGPLLEKVRATRDYQAAVDARKAAAKHVLDLQSESGTPQDDITQAARAVLDRGRAVTQIESAALGADGKVASAKARLDAANINLLKLRRDQELTIKNDPQIVTARQAIDQAQAELPPLQSAYNAALQKYNADTDAREKALNKPSRATADTSKKPYGKKRKKA